METENKKEQNKAVHSVDKLMKELKRLHIGTVGRDELKSFLNFRKNQNGIGVRYNLLIQGENDSENMRLVKEILNALEQLGVSGLGARSWKEENLGYDINEGTMQNCSTLIIHDCKGIETDSSQIVSSQIRSELQEKRRKKDKNWQKVANLSRQYPNCSIIVCGNADFADYLREDDDLYYRVFAHHITVQPMRMEEIIQATRQGVLDANLKLDKKAEAQLEEYIRVVYPKADLKDMLFVEDLLNRLLSRYYSGKKPSGTLTVADLPYYNKPRSIEAILEDLNKLVGLASVKEEFHKIYTLGLDTEKSNPERYNFAFVGNPGTGKTTVARLVPEILHAMGIIKHNKFVEVKPSDLISQYIGQSVQLLQEKINQAKGGVLFIDEAYFLISDVTDGRSPQKQCLDLLVQQMEALNQELCVILAGYPHEIDALLKSNSGLESRIRRIVKFEDYTNEELLQVFRKLCEKEKMILASNAEEDMLALIEAERLKKGFGNARSMQSLYQNLKAIALRKPEDPRRITQADIKELLPEVTTENLRDMIGMDRLQNVLDQFENRVSYIKYVTEKGMSIPNANLHMLFTGNPGTGKTTVARKMADCLYKIGILKTPNVVVAERKDLVASMPGATAQKTSEVIRSAIGGVLFIDEAYTLARLNDDGDYGREAVETIMTAMEEHKSDLVVIFAGYEEEMQHFLAINPGVASRIGLNIHFPDYSAEELALIYAKMLSDIGYTITAEAFMKAYQVMEFFKALDRFGNGRFVEHVVDVTINKRASRDYETYYNDIREDDVPTVDEMRMATPEGRYLETDANKKLEDWQRTAIHEVGHALVAFYTDPNYRVEEISILGDAVSRGRTWFQGSGDMSEPALRAQLAICFGGRNAERVVLGNSAPGCSGDYATARNMAALMVQRWAMGELGITTEMDLLQEADKLATRVLTLHKEELMQLVILLLREGVISGKKMRELLGRPEE